MLASVMAGKLTASGALAGGFIAFCMYAGAGYWGIALLGLFFVSGTMATSWKHTEKEKEGAAEKNKGRRKASQVIANGGVAGLAGLLVVLFPHYTHILQLMMAASLASAMADTLSSELGTVYGSRFFNILSFKKDQRGMDGVVSLEGTLIGIASSMLMVLLYIWGFKRVDDFWILVVAGTIGNLADSIMGALWERRHLIYNDAVNFLNTLIAAISAWVMYALF